MKRIITALVLIPVFTYVTLWAHPWVFLTALSLVALLCFHEYCGIVAAHGLNRPGPVAYAGGLLILLTPEQSAIAVTMLTLLTLALALRNGNLEKVLPTASAGVLGMIYIFGAWRFAISLRAASPYWLFFGLALSWIGDSAAYYAGRATGKHKLAPRISPAKSWEGSVAAFCVSLIFGFFYLSWLIPAFPVAGRLAISAAGNIAAQLGDLAESAIKRGAGIKDSGLLLPGHGGGLDRVDSTLFALPVIYLMMRVAW